jgi:hypothetical protein
MKRVITIATACFAVLFLTLCAIDARAQFVTNDKNILTFSAPIELPGNDSAGWDVHVPHRGYAEP